MTLHRKMHLFLITSLVNILIGALTIKADGTVVPTFCLTSIKGGSFGSLQAPFLRNLAKTFDADVFIETGTCLGYTSLEASHEFPIVHTIELSEDLYKQSVALLSTRPNIRCYLGYSPEVLNALLPTLKDKKIVFWLDGHYSGNFCNCIETARGPEVTPLINELESIKQAGIKSSVIVIDDIRLCEKSIYTVRGLAPELEDYPDLQEIVAKIYTINPDYQFIILKDALLAYPSSHVVSCSPVVKACTISRLYNGFNYTLEEVLQAEQTISQSQGDEQFSLYNLSCGSLEPMLSSYGFGKYYVLWQGLVKFHNKEFSEAYHLFSQAYDRGLNHWRVKWYQALALFKDGNREQCKALLEELLQANPECAPARNLKDKLTLQVYYPACKL